MTSTDTQRVTTDASTGTRVSTSDVMTGTSVSTSDSSTSMAVPTSVTTLDARNALEKKLTLEIIKKFPKAELHRHLDGSVRPSTVLDLAKMQGVKLPTNDLAELTTLMCVPDECTSLVEYLKRFALPLSVMQTSEAISRVMFEVCEDAWKDNVRYLEVRFSPILHIEGGLSLSNVMNAVCDGLALASFSMPIKLGIIVCGLRHLSPEVTHSLAEIAWRYKQKGVVGFDLAGPEDGFSSVHHKAAFELVRAKGVNCTIHSGEAAGAQSVADAIMYCGAHRIGHGLRLVEDPKLLQYVIDREIPIEACPISNVQTKGIARLKDSPVLRFLREDAVVTLCTDNTTVSNITMSSQYLTMYEELEMSVSDVVKLIDNAFRGSFLDMTTKKCLRLEAFVIIINVLREHQFDVPRVLERMWQHAATLGSLVSPQPAPLPPSPSVPVVVSKSPHITVEFVRRLPKADLHCRLDGSVSVELLFQELQSMGVTEFQGYPVGTLSDLRSVVEREQGKHSACSLEVAKNLFQSVLQTAEQLSRGLRDVFKAAVDDNVRYMEIMVRPSAHTLKSLSLEDVVRVLVSEREKILSEEFARGYTFGFVLFCNTDRDDIGMFRHVAELVVAHRQNGVFGFGVFGSDIPRHSFKYFASIFRYLKENYILVSMSAGKSSPKTIYDALHDGAASRVNAGFTVHEEPSLMAYLANHCVPVEVGPTEAMLEVSETVRPFAGNLIRLMLDQDLRVALCGFRTSLHPLTRSQVLTNLAQTTPFSTAEVLKLCRAGLRMNFDPTPRSLKLCRYKQLWEESVSVCASAGFSKLRTSPVYSPSTLV